MQRRVSAIRCPTLHLHPMLSQQLKKLYIFTDIHDLCLFLPKMPCAKIGEEEKERERESWETETDTHTQTAADKNYPFSQLNNT